MNDQDTNCGIDDGFDGILQSDHEQGYGVKITLAPVPDGGFELTIGGIAEDKREELINALKELSDFQAFLFKPKRKNMEEVN